VTEAIHCRVQQKSRRSMRRARGPKQLATGFPKTTQGKGRGRGGMVEFMMMNAHVAGRKSGAGVTFAHSQEQMRTRGGQDGAVAEGLWAAEERRGVK
jgi:hypothetical protein